MAGVDQRTTFIVGVSFWVGAGFQYGLIFPEFAEAFAGGMLRSGVTAGGLAAIVLTALTELAKPRRGRIETVLDVSALPTVREFVAAFAARGGWDESMANRLHAAAEETLLTLAGGDGDDAHAPQRRLLLTAYKEEGGAVLEFVAGSGEGNLEDRMLLLAERGEALPDEREVSLRLLRHLASSVRHEQYHDSDIVTVRVSA